MALLVLLLIPFTVLFGRVLGQTLAEPSELLRWDSLVGIATVLVFLCVGRVRGLDSGGLAEHRLWLASVVVTVPLLTLLPDQGVGSLAGLPSTVSTVAVLSLLGVVHLLAWSVRSEPVLVGAIVPFILMVVAHAVVRPYEQRELWDMLRATGILSGTALLPVALPRAAGKGAPWFLPFRENRSELWAWPPLALVAGILGTVFILFVEDFLVWRLFLPFRGDGRFLALLSLLIPAALAVELREAYRQEGSRRSLGTLLLQWNSRAWLVLAGGAVILGPTLLLLMFSLSF